MVNVPKMLTQEVTARLLLINSFATKAWPFAIKANNGEQVEFFIVF